MLREKLSSANGTNFLKAAVLAASAGLALGATGAATAGTVFTVTGQTYPGQTLADIDFSYNASLGKITIGLSNTSAPALGAATITGFTFNAPTNVTGVSTFMASGTSNDADWEADFDPNGINTPGSFTKFDVAGITGPNLNGGNVGSGIALGSSATFMFTLTGSNLNTLTESSFLSINSVNNEGVSGPFAVRFQAVGPNGGSDIAVRVVPVPSSALAGLAGMGALGILSFVSHRRKSLAGQ